MVCSKQFGPQPQIAVQLLAICKTIKMHQFILMRSGLLFYNIFGLRLFSNKSFRAEMGYQSDTDLML